MQINSPTSNMNSLSMLHRAHPSKHAHQASRAAQASSMGPIGTSGSLEKPSHKKPAPSVSDTSASPGAGTVVECGPFMPSQSGTQSTADSLTLDGLYAAWGQSKSPYDLTGDGTVDVDDLLAFINGLPEQGNELNAPSSTNSILIGEEENTITITGPAAQSPANEIFIDSTTFANSEPLSLDGFTKAWGQPNEQYDLNNDGTVDVDDLLTFINGLPNPSALNSPQAAVQTQQPGPPDVADKASTMKLSQAIQSLADTLIDKLISAGFEDQPPTNVRELVDKLQLSPRDTNHMFKRLQSQYPRGMGVNMVG